MKEIGGFFELELDNLSKPDLYGHPVSIRLNSARSGILYILESKKPEKVYIPYYSCNSVLEPITKLSLAYEYYNIDNNFKPIIDKKLGNNEILLYINYFGINNKVSIELAKSSDNIIIDNTQAFFSQQIKDIDTVYSPRKFFGVSDGGLLYTNKVLDRNFETDISYKKLDYLLKRIDVSASESYSQFIENEKLLNNQDIRYMSNLTSNILKSINYEKIKLIRERNFLYMHSLLSSVNELNVDINNLNAPLSYPFLYTKKNYVKQELIAKNIYIATYWKEVLDKVNSTSFENKLVNYLLPLPIDQRYDLNDMNYIFNHIKFLL